MIIISASARRWCCNTFNTPPMKLGAILPSLMVSVVLLLSGGRGQAEPMPAEAAGGYTFFPHPGGRIGGRGSVNVTKGGAFTGYIELKFLKKAFVGRFDETGTARVTLMKSVSLDYKGTKDVLDLSFSLGPDNEPRFDGVVTTYSESDDYPIAAFRAERNARAGSLAGRYSAVLTPRPVESASAEGEPVVDSAPTASSKAKIAVSPNGAVYVVGRTARRRPYSIASHLRADGGFHFYNAVHVFLVRSGPNFSAPVLAYDDALEGVVTLSDSVGTGEINWFYDKETSRKEVHFSSMLDLQATRTVEN